MPRKPQEAPAVKPKRGHLFDKLKEPRVPVRTSRRSKPVKVPADKLIKKPSNKASKANGRWTPRKVGAPKGLFKSQPRMFTDEMISKALWQAKGLTYAAAALIGMDYSYMCGRINKSTELLKIRQEALERRLDMAETCLDDLVLSKGPSQLGAVCFFLKTRGKARGYVEKQEVEQVNGPVNLDAMTDDQLMQLVEAIGKKLEGK